MRFAVRLLASALAILLAAATQMGEAGGSDIADCQPDVPPPLIDSNSTLVALQMHQWVWIENLTAPDWAPRTDSGGMLYEYLRPGVVRQQRLLLLTTYRLDRFVYVNVSFVTNGKTLCAAALTEHRNLTSGLLNRVSCSRICHNNFTSLGTRANLPLLVFDDWGRMSRSTEYLALDAVNPDSRASYSCLGHFKYERMANLPNLLTRQKRCPEGDPCIFNYDKSFGQLGPVFAGCKSEFNEYNWCVSDVELCSYNIEGDCPVCCRGELCNIAVAQTAYKRWLVGKGSPGSGAASVWALVLCALSLRWLRSDF